MTLNDYQKKALRTDNENLNNIDRLSNGLMGLNGEAGECIDILKKHLFQGHKLDDIKLVKELGDVLWYLAISANSLGFSLESIADINILKLEQRYPDGFSSDKSINRVKE